MAQSHFEVSGDHLTYGPTDGTQYVFQNTIYPAAQSSGNYQSTYSALNGPRIKKEFPDENGQEIKSCHKFNPLTIKQGPNIKQEPGIKMEPQEFNNAQLIQGRLVIDLTEEDDNPSTQKRPMPRAELLMAKHQHRKAARKPLETVQHPVESLFVQDDDFSGSASPRTSDWLLDTGEDDISG